MITMSHPVIAVPASLLGIPPELFVVVMTLLAIPAYIGLVALLLWMRDEMHWQWYEYRNPIAGILYVILWLITGFIVLVHLLLTLGAIKGHMKDRYYTR